MNTITLSSLPTVFLACLLLGVNQVGNRTEFPFQQRNQVLVLNSEKNLIPQNKKAAKLLR
jgi:hypothetical protein